jgi:hypothetical protein
MSKEQVDTEILSNSIVFSGHFAIITGDGVHDLDLMIYTGSASTPSFVQTGE